MSERKLPEYLGCRHCDHCAVRGAEHATEIRELRAELDRLRTQAEFMRATGLMPTARESDLEEEQ